MKNIYTDLALEERERFQKNVEIEGVEINKKYDRNLKMTTTVVDIVSEKGAETMGKPIGSYITIETKKLQEQRESERKKIAKQLSENLSEITKGDNIKNVLIVGLGNSLATPDALGQIGRAHV